MNETTKQPMHSEGQQSAPGMLRQPRIRLGAVIALAVAAGVIAWIAVGKDDSSTSSKGPTTVTRSSSIGPAAYSQQGLRALSAKLNHPIYWAATKKGYTYEVTRTTDGKIYVRYLPPGVRVGAKGSSYLIIATYPYHHAYQALKAVQNGRGHRIRGGGLAVVQNGYPQSVHVAFPNENYQVEVYDPSPKTSLAVALSGVVRPVS
jgi:hypothetical protein